MKKYATLCAMALMAMCLGALSLPQTASAMPGTGIKSAIDLTTRPALQVQKVHYIRGRWRRRHGRYHRHYRRRKGRVYVRAPFTRVHRSRRGIYVRAPFVRLWIPR